jgi:uncharacterized membrane protein YgdD (TMEM256/DUF423 family)
VNVARYLSIAAVVGFLAILLGTLAEHALRPRVDAESFRYLMTATRYLQVHSVALLGIAFALMAAPSLPAALQRGLRTTFALLLGGTALFAGSIFVSVASGIKAITYLTPVGGSLMMLGWLWLAATAWRSAAAGRD